MIEIKGSTLLDTVAATRHREGDTRYAEIVALMDDSTRGVLESKIFATAWYPLDALVGFLGAGLQYTGAPKTVLTKRAETLFERQLKGMYRVFVRLGSPEFVIRRLAVVHCTYFRGTSIAVEIEGHAAHVRYFGFGEQHPPARLHAHRLLSQGARAGRSPQRGCRNDRAHRRRSRAQRAARHLGLSARHCARVAAEPSL